MAGIALATAMACTVVLAAAINLDASPTGAIGMADEARRFALRFADGVTLFAGFPHPRNGGPVKRRRDPQAP